MGFGEAKARQEQRAGAAKKRRLADGGSGFWLAVFNANKTSNHLPPSNSPLNPFCAACKNSEDSS